MVDTCGRFWAKGMDAQAVILLSTKLWLAKGLITTDNVEGYMVNIHKQ